MFVYRYYDWTDIYYDRHTGWEVGFANTEFDDVKKINVTKFCTVKTFTDEMEAAEYCHWLNGGVSYKYDNRPRNYPDTEF